MIGWDDFPAALGLGDREVVALVGGGGKTTALFALGRHRPGRRVLTTTTKMGVDRTGGLEVLLDPTDEELEAALDQHGRVLVWSATAGARALGVERARCDRWSALADTVVVEADGSRRLPFKAPRAGEPVIPASTTQLVACVGMGAVGVPIGDGCHRPDRVAAVADATPADPLTPERLVRVLTSPDGSRKGIPLDARYGVLLNRVTRSDDVTVREIADRLDAAGIPLVVVADLPPTALPDRGDAC